MCSLNNIYCPQSIMKADWPNAACFNLSNFIFIISSKIIVQFRESYFYTNLQQICGRWETSNKKKLLKYKLAQSFLTLFVTHFSLFVTPWYLKIFKTILYCIRQILLQKSFWNLFVIPLMGFQIAQWRKCAHWEYHCKASSDWPVWYFRVNPSLRNKYILGI